MRYEVIGADRTTGRDVTRVYEASDEDHATRLANADGVVVDSVDLLIDMGASGTQASPPVPVASDPRMAMRVQPVTAPAPTASPAVARPATAVEYRGPDTSGVPSYGGLVVAGTILRVYAILCYAVGGVASAIAVLTIVGGAASTNGIAGLLVGLPILAPAFALLFAGAFAHAISAACVALRDIARNSWR